jgi:hypothetical protein
MPGSFQFHKLENFIVHNPKLLLTLISYVLVLVIYINLSVKSPVIGVVVFTLYFMINGIFLAHAFFKKEDAFFRLMFGVLLLIMLLGFVGWLIMIIHNLDVPKVILVLIIVSTICSMLNRRMRYKDVT